MGDLLRGLVDVLQPPSPSPHSIANTQRQKTAEKEGEAQRAGPSVTAQSPISVALVTGASSGIGAEIARDLASRGHSLLLVARRQAQLEALAEELRSEQVQVWVHAQDLGITDAAESLESAVTELGLQVDILVNNAGFGIEGPFMEMEADRLRTMVQLNMTTLTELTLIFGRDMAERGGGAQPKFQKRRFLRDHARLWRPWARNRNSFILKSSVFLFANAVIRQSAIGASHLPHLCR